MINLTHKIFTKNHVGHFPDSALFYICGGTLVFFLFETYGEGHDDALM